MRAGLSYIAALFSLGLLMTLPVSLRAEAEQSTKDDLPPPSATHQLSEHRQESIWTLIMGMSPEEQSAYFRKAVEAKKGAEWLIAQKTALIKSFGRLKNSDGSYSGAIWASPSDGKATGEPNYQYNWTRDSAIAASGALDLLDLSDTTDSERDEIWKILRGYVDFSRTVQRTPVDKEWATFDEKGNVYFVSPSTPGAIPYRYGEVKHEVVQKDLGNGNFKWVPASFKADWGRPQNDGPGLRATSLARVVEALLAQKETQMAKGGNLSSADEQTLRTAIIAMKKDLGFVKSRWRDPTFNLWEEVLGEHFFTHVMMSEGMENGMRVLANLPAQYRNLTDPTDFDARFPDPSDEQLAADLKREHQAIEKDLEKFWDKDRGFIISTRRMIRSNSPMAKESLEEDISVIMAAEHRKPGTAFSMTDPRVQATVARLYNSFKNHPDYEVNRNGKPGILVGRYPGDHWNGRDVEAVSGAHPWVIANLAMAEAFFAAAHGFHDYHQGEIIVDQTNRPFFELLFEGQLPVVWKWALNSGSSIRISAKDHPKEYMYLMENMRSYGTLISMRVPLSGMNPEHAMSEQIGVEKTKSKSQGAKELAWDCARYFRLVSSYRKLKAAVFTPK